MRLYLIRHAQSVNNTLVPWDPLLAVADPELTDTGRRQSDILASHLAGEPDTDQLWHRQDNHDVRGYGITRLYCSPMVRSLQTAQSVARVLGLAPEVWVDLHERGGLVREYEDERGVVSFPGRTRQQLLAEFPGYILPGGITDRGWWIGGPEDGAQVYERAGRVIDVLRRWSESAERVALISHGAFMDVLVKALLGHLPEQPFFFPHYNTGITRIDFLPDGRFAVLYLNRVEHLPPELIT